MKRILIFVDWFVPAFKAGGPVRSVFNLAKSLCNEAEVYVVCGDRDLNESEPLKEIKLNSWTKHQSINVFYCSPDKRTKSLLLDFEKQINPDIIYINGIFSPYFSFLTALTFRNSNRRVIIAPRGMLGKGALSIKPLRKKIFLGFWKNIFKLNKKLEIQATSESEAADIRNVLGQNVSVSVIPNISLITNSVLSSKKVFQPGKLRLVFYSRISKKKNLHFVFEIFKKLSTQTSIFFDVIGPAEDLDYYNYCQSLSKNLPANIKVEFIPAIKPEDSQIKLSEYDVFILPTLNENHGHVIFEALSAGLILLISDQTPFVNLEKEGLGFSLPLNDISAFAKAIDNLCKMSETEYFNYKARIQTYYTEKCNAENAILANVNYFLKDE